MICIDHYALSLSNTKYILFPNIEENYAPMFLLADGQNLCFQNSLSNETSLLKCSYLDDYHFTIGSTCFHRDQFAEIMYQNKHVYEPETYVTDLNVYQKFFADRKILDEQGRPVPYYALVGKGEQNYYGRPAYLFALCPAAERDRRIALVHSIGNAQAIRFCSCADLEKELTGFHGCVSFPTVQPDPRQVRVQLSDHETRFLSAALLMHGHERHPALDSRIQSASRRRPSSKPESDISQRFLSR